AHHAADVMGTTITSLFTGFQASANASDYVEALEGNEWVATDRLDAETVPNRNFTSWQEFFGPHMYDGDNFTTTQRYDLSNPVFDLAAVDDEGGNFTVFGYTNTTPTTVSPP